ncbi:MAG: hypothetical protein LC749_05175, partial [Actinobacteria bacterium]|nr:hypothetical protein [Actinomycetota bacterium]
MADSHLPGALLSWLIRSLDKINSPTTEGHFGVTTRGTRQLHRWIRAKEELASSKDALSDFVAVPRTRIALAECLIGAG